MFRCGTAEIVASLFASAFGPDLTDEEWGMAFTYEAKPSAQGNENIARKCGNSRCGGTMYVSHGAQNYTCPHCKQKQ